jgi:hypothetical protein
MSVSEAQGIQVTTFAGDRNQVVTIGRDLVVAETIVQAREEEFFPLNLTQLREVPEPQSARQLAAMAQRQRVLLLGGRYEDKVTVARQVARRLAEGDGGSAALPVLERGRASDYPGLLRAIREKAERAVFVITDVLPQHVGYDPARLREAAAAGGHLVVLTTERPREAWELAEGARAFWHELDPEGLFDPALLAGELFRRLRRAGSVLAPGTFVEDAEPDLSTLGGVPLRTLVAELKTPVYVDAFVRQLAELGPNEAVDGEAVARLVETATSGERRIERWFHTVLEPHEQLLALSLSLFNGLFDDQYFAALEEWVAHIRAHRDPHQRAFDYADLDNLRTHFTLVESDFAGTRLESRESNQRLLVIRAAWRSHRRQIMGALPVLTSLAARSVQGRSRDPELYGSRERRSALRQAVGDALSDVGLRSASSVQHALLELAGDRDPDVQWVAARAVARWREEGADGQLFDLLEHWQKDARLRGILTSILEGREEEDDANPLAYIRATIALAVAEAAGYDPPNQVNPRLVELMEELAGDGNKLVRDRFSRFTLPWVASLHLAQLRERLYRMARYVDLTHAIGAALAYAYRTDPAAVVETLEEWHAHTARDRPGTFHPGRITHRDSVLITLAFAYGELEYEDAPGGTLSTEKGFARLKEMLAREGHPKVRTAVVIAVGRQARRRFAQVEPLLQALVAEVTEDEREEIVRILGDLYLEQRKGLEGKGAVRLSVGDEQYPVWTGATRPQTAVETALLRWLRSPETPAAQRMALQASLSFARRLDEEEAARIARLRETRRQRAEDDQAARISTEPVRATPTEPGWYAGTFVPWLATVAGAGQYLPVLRGLVPEALVQHASRPSTLALVLDRWERPESDPDTRVIAQRLRLALEIHPWAWILLPAAALVLLIILVVVF